MKNQTQTFWQRWIAGPIKDQLSQGVSSDKMAWTCATGVAVGVFPIIGSSTVLLLAAGVVFKLNQPVLHTLNYALTPVQIALVPVYVKLGELIFGAPHLSFVPTELVREFTKDPMVFLSKFGMAGVHGISAWVLTAPCVIFGIYFLLSPVFKKMSEKSS
jgi:uncharacterized protein (DUF2062 family)